MGKVIGRKNGVFKPDNSSESFNWVNLCLVQEENNCEGVWPSILKVDRSFQEKALTLPLGGDFEPMFNSKGKVVDMRPLSK